MNCWPVLTTYYWFCPPPETHSRAFFIVVMVTRRYNSGGHTRQLPPRAINYSLSRASSHGLLCKMGPSVNTSSQIKDHKVAHSPSISSTAPHQQQYRLFARFVTFLRRIPRLNLNVATKKWLYLIKTHALLLQMH